jgi:molybdate-binding protein
VNISHWRAVSSSIVLGASAEPPLITALFRRVAGIIIKGTGVRKAMQLLHDEVRRTAVYANRERGTVMGEMSDR